MLPAIVKDKNWDPIARYGITATKKDIKVRAKIEWGLKVAQHLSNLGLNIDTNVVSAEVEAAAL